MSSILTIIISLLLPGKPFNKFFATSTTFSFESPGAETPEQEVSKAITNEIPIIFLIPQFPQMGIELGSVRDRLSGKI